MVGLRAPVFGLLSLLMVGEAFASPSEIPFGENKKLGITFQVNGGQEWCAPQVKVSLKAEKPLVFTENSEEFQHMLGRIRAVIEGFCPEAGRLLFQGESGGKTVTVGESARYTNWVYVPHTVAGKRPPCTGPENAALCDQRWDVFMAMRDVFSQPGFEKAVLTRYLTTEGGADAEFVAGNASGRVSFLPFESGVPFKTSTEFVKYQIDKLRKQCNGTFTPDGLEALDSSSTLQGASCATVTKSQHTYFLIRQTPKGFEVTGFSDFTQDGNAARQLATRFAAVVTHTTITQTGWAEVKSDTFPDAEYPTLQGSPCAKAVEGYVGLDSKAVAVRLWPEGERGSEEVALGVFVGNPPQIAPDRWRIRVKLRPFERDNVWVGAVRGSWLVFKIIEESGRRRFQNQLFVARSSSTCTPLKGTNDVTVANMPTRAVELFAEGIGIHAEASGSEKALRAALEQWSMSETSQ